MRPSIVVIVTPERQGSAGIGEGVEYLLVQASLGCMSKCVREAQIAVEAFDVAVLLRLA